MHAINGINVSAGFVRSRRNGNYASMIVLLYFRLLLPIQRKNKYNMPLSTSEKLRSVLYWGLLLMGFRSGWVLVL
jgi:hypothetical protein